MSKRIEMFVLEFIRDEIQFMKMSEFQDFLLEKKKWAITPAVEDKNKISYYKVGTLGELPDDFDEPEVRRKKAKMQKPGRFLQDLFDRNLSDDVARKFAEEYKKKFGSFEDNVIMEIWNCVRDAYDTENYRQPENGSPLWNSCMNDKMDLIRFWEDIGVKVLVAQNEDEAILGRALVWNNVKDWRGNRYTFMDRVYTYSDDLDVYFINYAEENGWIYKEEYKSAGTSNFIFPNGQEESMDLFYPIEFSFDELRKGAFPYSDTIQHIDFNGLNTKDGIGMLDETDGNSAIDPDCTLDVDGEIINLEQDEYVIVDGEIYPIEHPDIVSAVTHDGQQHVHMDDCVFSEIGDMYILMDYAVHVEDEDDHVPEPDVFEDKDGNMCFKGNEEFSEVYGDVISERLAMDHPEFGLVYPQDIEEESFPDLDQSGRTITVNKVNGYIVVNGDLVHEDDVVAYNGEVYHFDEISEVHPTEEVADGIV